jgi:hypothetical protein
MEIDQAMYATVHSQPLTTSLNVQGFPFGEGHPAREITRDVIQGFLKTADEVNQFFTSSEAESVLISSFLKYPVHPSVITSFTQPLGAAINRVGSEGKLQASFWLWRRARILENFIPLPDELRLAAIRGYAVARSIGYMTGHVDSQNKIISKTGTHPFPKWMLTATDEMNLLPALLEAMVLTFGDAPTKGKAAFNAYGALLDLGSGGPTHESFDILGDFKEFLEGRDLPLTPLDAFVVENLPSLQTAPERKEFVLGYLETKIEDYKKIAAAPLVDSHWRSDVGKVEPANTLSLELMDDLLRGFTQVADAVKNVSTATRRA